MAKLDEGFEEVPVELDEGFEETSLDDGFEPIEMSSKEEPRGFTEDKPSQLEAATRSAGQGLTFGFADEIAGGLQAAADVATSDNELKDLPELYRRYRDLQRERDVQASKDFPKTSLGSEIGGSIPLAFTPAGAANTASKAAKLAGATGLGKSEADLTEPSIKNVGRAALDTGTSAVLGKYAHKGSDWLGQGLKNIKAGKPFNAIGDTLQTQAEDLALSTLGTNKKALQSEIGQSIFTPADYRKGIGEEAINMRGILDGPVDVKVNAANEIKKLEEIKKPLLEKANQELKARTSIGDMSNLQEGSLSQTLRQLKDKMVDREAQTTTNIASVQTLNEQLEDTIQRYASKDNDILALNEFKKLLGDKLKDAGFKKQAQDLPQEAEFIRNAYDLVKKRIEGLADIVEPGLGKRIKEMNARENNLYDLGSLAKDAQIKDIGRASKWNPAEIVGDQLDKVKVATAKGLSNTAKQFGNIGQTIESASIPNAIARPLIEEGKEQVTSLQDTKANAPVKLSQNLYTADESELQQVASTLENDPQYSAYGSALRKSLSEKSDDKKKAALFTILQNPNMRKLIYPETMEEQK